MEGIGPGEVDLWRKHFMASSNFCTLSRHWKTFGFNFILLQIVDFYKQRARNREGHFSPNWLDLLDKCSLGRSDG